MQYKHKKKIKHKFSTAYIAIRVIYNFNVEKNLRLHTLSL